MNPVVGHFVRERLKDGIKEAGDYKLFGSFLIQSSGHQVEYLTFIHRSDCGSVRTLNVVGENL